MPITATTKVMINTAASIMMCDPRLSVKQLTNILDISIGSFYTILFNCLHMPHNGSYIITTCHLMLQMLFWNFWLKKASPLYHTPIRSKSCNMQFWLFPTIKKDLKGKHSVNEMAALKVFEATLKRLPQEDFASIFQKGQKCGDKTI